MRYSRICTTSSTLNSAKPISIRCGGNIVRCNVLAARATTLAAGAPTNIAPGASATGVIAASAPSTISPILWCTRASGPGVLAPGHLFVVPCLCVIAREVCVHVRTSYRWCWGLRNAALSYEMQRQVEGTVEADELYHTAGQKGQAKQGGKQSLGRRARGRRKKREPGRGHYY